MQHAKISVYPLDGLLDAEFRVRYSYDVIYPLDSAYVPPIFFAERPTVTILQSPVAPHP